MPKLWTATIETHRREVHDAVIDTTAALVREHGLPAVTMTKIAEETGIGRATLYKYFPDVEAILVAGHERQVAQRLASLAAARDGLSDPRERLEAVLEAYADMRADHRASAGHGPGHRPPPGAHHGGEGHPQEHLGEIAALVHRSEHVARAQRRLLEFMRDVVREAAKVGAVRSDVPAEELARYCLEALAGARDLPSRSAVRRLVAVTLDGLRGSA